MRVDYAPCECTVIITAAGSLMITLKVVCLQSGRRRKVNLKFDMRLDEDLLFYLRQHVQLQTFYPARRHFTDSGPKKRRCPCWKWAQHQRCGPWFTRLEPVWRRRTRQCFTTFWQRETPSDFVNLFVLLIAIDLLEAMARAQHIQNIWELLKDSVVLHKDKVTKSLLHPLTSTL